MVSTYLPADEVSNRWFNYHLQFKIRSTPQQLNKTKTKYNTIHQLSLHVANTKIKLTTQRMYIATKKSATTPK